MARKTKDEINRIKKELADLIFNHKDEIKFVDGKPSPTQLSDLLKERGLDVSRQSIARFLEEGVDGYRQTILIEDNDKVREIKEAMKVQKEIWQNPKNKPSDRSKASNSWKALNKQLIEYEAMLTEARLKRAEVTKPNYLIKIEPPNILKKCPKCGHKFYDIEDHKKDKEKETSKPIFSKDCEEQKQFDDFEDDEK